MEGKSGTKPRRRKYPAPQVRQTVSSMIRLVRANPLILQKNTGTKDCTADELLRKLPARIRNDPYGIESNKRRSVDFTRNHNDTSMFGRGSIAPIKTRNLKKNQEHVFTRPKTDDLILKPQKLALVNVRPTQSFNFALKRKSCSVGDVSTANGLGPLNCTATQSMESLSVVSPINSSKVIFKTPNRSTKIRNSTPKRSKTPSLMELQTRLKNWLEKRRKAPSTFQHLNNIRDHVTTTNKIPLQMNPVVEKNIESEGEQNLLEIIELIEDKENIAGLVNTADVVAEVAGNYISDKGDVNDNDLLQIFEEIMVLIEEGYDPEHCQFWLRKISERYEAVEEMSQFWECKAALEQIGDNVNEAIECYKTAIIHGAAIKAIDESLDKLFNKFGALNIGDPINFTPNTKSKAKNSHIICNQFKSSIIQFAVLQKKIKSNTKEVKMTTVVTPVRRSSRLTHIKTPNLQLSSSLQQLGKNDEINFQNNPPLFVRYK